MRIMNGILIWTIVGLLIAPLAKAQAAGDAKPATGPTAESVLAAEEEYIRAMRENDAEGIARCLSDDWAVISAKGGVGEGKSIFPDGVKQGHLTRKAYEFSEPRVRLYGNVALVTVKVHTAGMFVGKPFDVMERETDVWLWKDGSWQLTRRKKERKRLSSKLPTNFGSAIDACARTEDQPRSRLWLPAKERKRT
jgi:ketosteroid isomerase-like protein